MLSRRLQTILNVRKHAALLRLYFAGHHAQPNPRPYRDISSNQRITSKKIHLPICTTQRWFVESPRNDRRISRACHTLTDDDSAEPRTENGFARSVLARTKDCKSIAVPLENIDDVTDDEARTILDRDWQNASADEILEAFRKLSCHAKNASQCLDDEKHKNILIALTANLTKFSDEQLHEICRCFAVWKDIIFNKTEAFVDFCEELDKQLLTRLVDWTPEEALMMCDHLYLLRLARKVTFPSAVMKKLGKKPTRLSQSNFLHFMFMLNVCRAPYLNMYEVEYALDKIVERFTADELGIVAMAFFKTQTPVRDPRIVSAIQKKVLEEIDTIDDIALSAILKTTRYSTGLKDLKTLGDILEAVKPRVPKLEVPCLIHIAHTAAFVQLYNAELMEMIVDRFTKNVDKARLKDLERIALALSIFNYDRDAPVYGKIIECLRDPTRAAELERYATLLPSTLLYLSNARIFPMDLIRTVLDPEFLMRAYKNNAYKIGYASFALESNVRTEFPEYDGPFLPENIRSFIAKRCLKDLMAKMEKKAPSSFSDKLIMEVAHICKLVLDSDRAIHIDYILPQWMKPDIIICFDENGNTVEPAPILSKLPFGMIKQPPPEARHFKWIAVVFGTQNQVIKKTNQYIGPFIMKLRQLRKLGFHPVVITHHEWILLQNLEAKEKFVRNILPISSNSTVSAEAI